MPRRASAASVGVEIAAARDPVHEPRALGDRRLQAGIVEVEPARAAGVGRVGVDGDDLEVGAREGVGRDAKDPVVRAHQRVPAAGRGRDAERALAPRDALVERARGEHEVVEFAVHDLGKREWRGHLLGAYSVTLPSMQVTLAPPTQVSPSRWLTCTRPARPSRAPCAAT